MRKINLIITIIISLLTSINSWAQECKATAKLDSTTILIGDYLNVQLQIIAPQKTIPYIQTPSSSLLDSLNIEIIGYSAVDTIHQSANIIYHQTITITSFDSGNYVFPPILILDKDSNWLAVTESLHFQVNTIAVDTTAAIRDIKPIAKAPLTFRELLPMILLALAITIAIVVIVLLYIKYGHHKKRKKPIAAPIVAKEKAHIIALQALEQLRLKKLWENGLVKLYYSELTDILRSYIANRYEVDAREMVTTEIMEALDNKPIADLNREALEQLLTTADLVKFAKWAPLPPDNDLYFKNAKDFIEHTAENIDNLIQKSKKI